MSGGTVEGPFVVVLRLAVMDVVTTRERPDLEEEASAAFREKWPEFIFHDPIAKQYVAKVNEYFPQYDVLLLDEGRVVAGGWGVQIRWDGTVVDLPDGYDGAMAAPSKIIRAASQQRH